MKPQVLYALLRRLAQIRPLAAPHQYRAAANAAVATIERPHSCGNAWFFAAGQLGLSEAEQEAFLRFARETLQQ